MRLPKYDGAFNLNILALDTATQTLSCAIMSDGKIVAEFSTFMERTQTERVMPLIDSILKAAQIDISQIDCYACTVGPGSFTGIRIGISTIKGLAYANGKEVAAISSLDALCENVVYSPYQICPLIDARKAEVYGAFYKKDKGGNILEKGEEFNLLPEVLVKKVKKKTLFFGNGALLYKDVLSAALKDKAEFVYGKANYIIGSNVAKLAAIKIRNGEAMKPEYLVPVYIRKSDVEQASFA